MNVSFAMRVQAPSNVLVQELPDESFLLNLKTEVYFGLDDVGKRMWQLLVAEPTIQQAFDRLLGEYDVDPEQLRGDLTKLIEELVSHGLVEVLAN